MRTAALAIALASLAGTAGIAAADTVRGEYTSSLGRDINITRNGNTGDVRTVQFNWARSDSPGPGVDPYLPINFDSYCVELDQNVAPSTKYTFDVLSPSAAGLSSFQELMLERLWASFKPVIDTSLESATFQAIVWEIIYDSDDMDIRADDFRVNPPSDGLRDLADTWIGIITDAGYAGPVQNVVILHNAEIQDQITAVPAPATAALGLLAVGVGARRRRVQ